MDEHTFEWKTLVGALLSPKKCPKDNEEMNGSWTYCPYHEDKLVPVSE